MVYAAVEAGEAQSCGKIGLMENLLGVAADVEASCV